MQCVVCGKNQPMYGDSRCEDCWAQASQFWKWRGELPLEIRMKRAKSSTDTFDDWERRRERD